MPPFASSERIVLSSFERLCAQGIKKAHSSTKTSELRGATWIRRRFSSTPLIYAISGAPVCLSTKDSGVEFNRGYDDSQYRHLSVKTYLFT